MTNPTFQKSGTVTTLRDRLSSEGVYTPPDAYLGQIFDALNKVHMEGRREAEGELRRIVEDVQQVNMVWATRRFEDLHKDPRYRFLDTLLVREDGRVATGWSSFFSYLSFPEIQPPPAIGELLDMALEREMLLYPLISRRSVWMFCRSENLPDVSNIVGKDMEYFPYGDGAEYTFGYVPDGRLTPAKVREAGLVLGNLGLWATSEKYLDFDHGDPDKIIAYRPRVYMDHNRHPAAKFVYITSNMKADSIVAGHLPMEERIKDSIRIEMDPEAQNVVIGIFNGYQNEDRVNDIPLILRHRRYTPWTEFYPRHGGSETQQ